MCDYIIATAIGIVALFPMTDYPECLPGHPYIGYSDDKHEIVCWGFLTPDLVEAVDLEYRYSVTGKPEAPSPNSCESPVPLPQPETYEDPAPAEFLLRNRSFLSQLMLRQPGQVPG
jgi:hypothetical protein